MCSHCHLLKKLSFFFVSQQQKSPNEQFSKCVVRPSRARGDIIQLINVIIPEPLLTSEFPQLVDNVHSLIERFDIRHAMYGNKEYADLLWQVCTRNVSFNIVQPQIKPGDFCTFLSSATENAAVVEKGIYYENIFLEIGKGSDCNPEYLTRSPRPQ